MEFAGKVREYFYGASHERIILTLDKIQMDNTFDTKHRSDTTGLPSCINTKQFMATMYSVSFPEDLCSHRTSKPLFANCEHVFECAGHGAKCN